MAMERPDDQGAYRRGRDPADRRRAARVPVELDARVRELGSEGIEANVLNISTPASWPNRPPSSRSARGSG